MPGTGLALILCHANSGSPSPLPMQPRYSGRLSSKEDERALENECRLLGPLLANGEELQSDRDKELNTLPRIVRAIASGAS